MLVGAGRRTRTADLLITNQLLYRLSHTSIFLICLVIISKVNKGVNRKNRQKQRARHEGFTERMNNGKGNGIYRIDIIVRIAD